MNIWNGYQKGINLGGWLSQCVHTKEHYDSFINESDIDTIAATDMDHIRLPIDYNLLQDKNGNWIPENFSYIDDCLSWCQKNNLNLVFDLHKTAGYSFDKGENESGNFFYDENLIQQFLALWEELAKRYGKYDPNVAFELLNEVVNPEDNDAWMAIAKRAVEIIRKYAPTVKILLGSYWNTHVLSVKDIADPFDEHIIYNFHCYEPLIFTHQNAHWMPEIIGHFIKYPVSKADYESATKEMPDVYHFTDWAIGPEGFNTDYYEKLFAEAIEIAEKKGVMLYCGEYGVIDQADSVSKEAWLKDIREVFAKHNIGNAVWTYKKLDFGVMVP